MGIVYINETELLQQMQLRKHGRMVGEVFTFLSNSRLPDGKTNSLRKMIFRVDIFTIQVQ